MHIDASARAWAQVVLRRYAAATNLLVPGQRFAVLTPDVATAQGPAAVPAPRGRACTPVGDVARVAELLRCLREMGALVEVHTTGGQGGPASPASAPGDRVSGALTVIDTVPVTARASTCPRGTGRRSRADDRDLETDSTATSGRPGFPAPDSARVTPSPSPGPVRVHAPVDRPASAATVLGPDRTPLVDPSLPDPTRTIARRALDRLSWARAHMPVTTAAVARMSRTHMLRGRRIGLSLVLEPKTAVLALELSRAGARVSVFGHAEETRPEIAQALSAAGIRVFADADADHAREDELARDFLRQGLEVLLDDGSHLIRLAHDPALAPQALEHLVGCAEETTSGLRALHGFPLRVPVIASNDARSKTLFDNAYGTGQSCLMTALDLLDPAGVGVALWDRTVVVAGYGDVGRGFCRMAGALGARILVAEPDPVRALQARMDGHPTAPLAQLAVHADWVVSATGVRHTVTPDVLRAMRPGSVVLVIGGVDQEVALDEVLTAGASLSPVSRGDVGVRSALVPTPPNGTEPVPPAGPALPVTPPARPMRAVEHLHLPGGPTLVLLDRGNCLNVTAGEGNPIEIMDLSFAVQVAALELLLHPGTRPGPGVHPLPTEKDDAVASAALRLWGALPLDGDRR